MKLDLTEYQYIQLAQEQFCQLLREVPAVSDIELVPTGFQRGFGDFHAIVHLTDGMTLRFFAEVKSSGERRFANLFMRLAAQHEGKAFCLFAAPYISESTAQLLRENRYSYLDLCGNCCICAGSLYIFVSGKANRYAEKRVHKNLFARDSRAASTVLRTMLNQPEKVWQVKELAMQAEKSLGTVSNLKHALLDMDYAEEVEKGFRLHRIGDMLSTWAKAYRQKDALTYEYYSLDTAADIESAVADWNRAHAGRAMLGGFCAAARYAPVVRYKRVQVYVEQQDLREFIEDLELTRVSSGGNVVITVPHDETPCMFAREVRGNLVASPVQTVLDLLGDPARGEEAAQAIILKEYGE